MKKKLVFSFIFFLTLSVFPTEILAVNIDTGIYNSNNEVRNDSVSKGLCPTAASGISGACKWNNQNHQTVKVYLAYIDNGNIVEKIGRELIIAQDKKSDKRDMSELAYSVGQNYVNSLISAKALLWASTINNSCSANGKKITQNLHDGTMWRQFLEGDTENFKAFLSRCLWVDINSLNKSNFKTPGERGYRLVIEPMLSAVDNTKGEVYLKTVKEYALMHRTNSDWFTLNGRSYHTIFKTAINDVGITAPVSKSYETQDYVAEVASYSIGYGMNLFDVSTYLDTCKQKKAKLTYGSGEYWKLQNDTIWNLLYGNPTQEDKECYTCEEMMDYYSKENTYYSGVAADGKAMLTKLKATGYIPWTSASCKINEDDNSCADFKKNHPNATYDEMKGANVTWPGCYTCENDVSYYSYANCGSGDTDTPKGELCNFNLDISLSNNCTVSTKSYVHDIENWGCIFTSTTSEDTNVQTHFYQEDMKENRFCDIYCREEVDYKYSGNNMTVLAGQRFTIGYGLSSFPVLKPVNFKSTTTCRTTSSSKTGQIDLDAFVSAYNSADDVVSTKWDEYQRAKVERMAAENATVKSTSSGSCTCCSGTGKDKKCSSCGSYETKDYEGEATNGVYKEKASWSYTTGCKTGGTSKTDKEEELKEAEKTAKTAYENAIKDRTGVIEELHECNSFQYTNRKFSPNLYFKYEEEMYGGESYNLDKDVSISSKSKYYVSGDASSTTGNLVGSKAWSTNKYKSASQDIITESALNLVGSTTTIAKNACVDGQKCTKSATDTYENNNWSEQVTTKEYDYSLPSGVYEYITKPSGLSVNTLTEAKAESTVYYYLGGSSLPVHYNRKEGKYDYYIDYDTFGKSGSVEHKFDKYIFNGAQVGSSYGTNKGIYDYLWNTTWSGSKKIKDMIASCSEGGGHMHHSFIAQINKPVSSGSSTTWLDLFTGTSCYTDYGCYRSGSLIECQYYYDNGVKKRAGSSSRNSTNQLMYKQIQECINTKRSTASIRVAFNNDTTYECTYKVKNEIVDKTDYKDLNIIYRTISLNDPFPGKDGDTREAGSNWNWQPLIDLNITNNRETETEDMYKDLDPLYKITLTPSLIKEIRKYNDEQDTKSVTYYNNKSERVTGNAGYSDFNLTCTGGTHCLSSFIRDDFKKYFSGCGIDDTGLRCNSSEEWVVK